MNEIRDLVNSLPTPPASPFLAWFAIAVAVAIYLKIPQAARAMVSASGDLVETLTAINDALEERNRELEGRMVRQQQSHDEELAAIRRKHQHDVDAIRNEHRHSEEQCEERLRVALVELENRIRGEIQSQGGST